VPFAKPEDPRTDLEEEEYTFFQKEESKYNRHAAYLNAKNGYGTFAVNWDLEVATRFKSKAAGEEVTLINRKTATQLQEHYNRLNKHLDKARLVRPSNIFRDQMENVLNTTRRERIELQGAQVTQPIQYNQNCGLPCFGNPTTLNTPIAAAAFQYNNQPNTFLTAPFALRPINANTPLLLGGNFNRNKYCFRCGFQKKLHNNYGVPLVRTVWTIANAKIAPAVGSVTSSTMGD
jgi:hypothetical protein